MANPGNDRRANGGGIAQDYAGTLYVGDYSSPQGAMVRKLDIAGNLLDTWYLSLPFSVWAPDLTMDIAIDNSSSPTLFVLCTDLNSGQAAVLELDSQGNQVSSFLPTASSYPHSLDLEPGNGRLFLLGSGNAPVSVYSTSGNHVTSWGQGELIAPGEIATSGYMDILVADHAADNIKYFTSGGTLIQTLTVPGTTSFSDPRSVTVSDNGGSVYVRDNSGIHVFTR